MKEQINKKIFSKDELLDFEREIVFFEEEKDKKAYFSKKSEINYLIDKGIIKKYENGDIVIIFDKINEYEEFHRKLSSLRMMKGKMEYAIKMKNKDYENIAKSIDSESPF